MTPTRAIALAVIPFTLIMASGCASTGDLDAVRKLAQEAKDSADRANQKSDQALATANEAKAAAANAQRTADEAKAAAQHANERVDRAFKKSVQK